ncbi:MAG TPA: hypothetical protein DCM05_12295 [Elusimicrobia bacterium]|nr:hypothetical protein [Elusimicrobiota bacterium]
MRLLTTALALLLPCAALAAEASAPGAKPGKDEVLPQPKIKENQDKLDQKAAPVTKAVGDAGAAKAQNQLDALKKKSKDAKTQGVFDLLQEKELQGVKKDAFHELNPSAPKEAGASDASRAAYFDKGGKAMNQAGKDLAGGRKDAGARLGDAEKLKGKLEGFDGGKAQKSPGPVAGEKLPKDSQQKPVRDFGRKGEGKPLTQAAEKPLSPKVTNYAAKAVANGTVKPSDIHPIKEGDKISQYRSMINTVAKKYGVDPQLVEAHMRAENPWGDPMRTSPAGAKGLMQLMPGTAAALKVDPRSPVQSVDGGTRMIRDLYKQFDDDPVLATAAYNAGPTIVGKLGRVPNYPETKTYVGKVFIYYSLLKGETVPGL